MAVLKRRESNRLSTLASHLAACEADGLNSKPRKGNFT